MALLPQKELPMMNSNGMIQVERHSFNFDNVVCLSQVAVEMYAAYFCDEENSGFKTALLLGKQYIDGGCSPIYLLDESLHQIFVTSKETISYKNLN